VVLGRGLVAGALVAGALVGSSALASGALLVPAAAAAASTPSASTLYREAMATTRSWSVHYASASTQSKVTLLVSGDAGPASGTQTVMTRKGSLTDTATIVVIGGITFVKGNLGGLEDLAGMSPAQATVAQGQWVQFATTNVAFSQVVVGVRSHDVAQELALKGPLSLGHPRTVGGYAVDAIEGSQTLTGHKSQRVVLYVRAQGTHVPVEEDSLSAQGQRTTAEHVTYSDWGEIVRPQAPQATVSIGPVGSA
jgi:hypothetical protein